MYTMNLYFAFVQLRKQIYKIKTRKGGDKYTSIELNRSKYKTFEKFYIEAQTYIFEFDKNLSVQEVFDTMLDKSQTKIGIKKLCN
ncbi:MAG: hypothetical protein PHN31_01750 [Candidatus Gracilibacteria bacterium]|nr:hypothetical protein [Candidatus Gracilibacteria bacterium]